MDKYYEAIENSCFGKDIKKGYQYLAFSGGILYVGTSPLHDDLEPSKEVGTEEEVLHVMNAIWPEHNLGEDGNTEKISVESLAAVASKTEEEGLRFSVFLAENWFAVESRRYTDQHK